MTRISETQKVVFDNYLKTDYDSPKGLSDDLIFDFDAGSNSDFVELNSDENSNPPKKKKLPDEITVQKNDTIESLAAYLGITPKEFKKTYGVTKISKGQKLTKKSTTSSTSTTTKKALPNEITVQKDDTIESLSKYLGITQEEFKKVYGVKSISKGQILTKKTNNSAGSNTSATSNNVNNKPTKKNMEGFLYALRCRESTNNYKTVSGSGYLGAYQFGERALADLGIYKESDEEGYKKNDWVGIVKKNDYGVTSISGFLSSEKQQDDAMKGLIRKNWGYIKSYKLKKHIGKTYAGVKMTVSGMIAGAHLVGIGGLKTFLDSGGTEIPKDGNGTPITDYIRDYGGYDLGL